MLKKLDWILKKRKEDIYDEKDNQETSKGKVMSKDTSDEYTETKPKALKAIANKNRKVFHC